MYFCDSAIIRVKAGNGGAGSASFRREKYVDRGGPDGGNGGNGGHVILTADENLNTLSNFLGKKHYKAKNGEPGRGRQQYGHDAENIVLNVPVGTLVYDHSAGALIADLTKNGASVIVARGGKGGKGNTGFTTSIRQAPDFAELGEPGEEKELRLELKLIADVALVGYPSAGKSTLISRISNARPKIADYPFTTLVPNLGTVQVDQTDFVVADIPGLIEGAHAGKGLGIEFLKHIERTKILVHLLDITREDMADDYKKLNKELRLFSLALSKKPQILAINKIDTVSSSVLTGLQIALKKKFAKKDPLFISCVSGEGIQSLLYRIKTEIVSCREKEKRIRGLGRIKETKVFHPEPDLPDARQYTVEKTKKGFRIFGKRIEQIAIMTDFSKRGAVIRLHDVLKKIGADRELTHLGAKEGDPIQIGSRIFAFRENISFRSP